MGVNITVLEELHLLVIVDEGATLETSASFPPVGFEQCYPKSTFTWNLRIWSCIEIASLRMSSNVSSEAMPG